MTRFDTDALTADLPDPGQDAEQRQQAFEKNLKRNIQIARSGTLPEDKRLEAIRWLGEAGDPQAITVLTEIYESGSPRLRKAAEYALGMYAALQKAINHKDPRKRDQALKNLEKIVYDGKFGRRARPGPYYIVSGILLATLVALIGVGVLLNNGTLTLPGPSDPVAAVPTTAPAATLPADPGTVGDALRSYYDALNRDATLISMQLQRISRNNPEDPVDCEITLIDPPAFSLPEALPANDAEALGSVAQELNRLREQIAPARAAFNQHCSGQRVDRQQVVDLLIGVAGVQAELIALAEPIEALPRAAEVPAIAATDTATAEPITEPIVEATPEATTGPGVIAPPTSDAPTEAVDTGPDISLIRPETRELQRRLDDMNATGRGLIQVLNQFWTDVQTTGSTGGCLEPIPVLPEDFALAPELANADLPELRSAVDNYNLGLELTRQAWNRFDVLCDQGNQRMEASVGQEFVFITTAIGAFENAQTDLDAALQSLR